MATTVLELLSDPKAWTKGTYARDAEGGEVDPDSPRAVCWCLLGAVRRVRGYMGDDFPEYQTIRTAAQTWLKEKNNDRYPCPTVSDFNDDPDTTHEDVLTLARDLGL